MITEINPKNRGQYNKRQWTTLINTISGFKNPTLVGTVDSEGRENLSIVSSLFHLGADPPLMGFVLRPHSQDSPRHTLMNIEETQVFTLNMVTKDIYQNAHQTSARYPRAQSEFNQCGLTSHFRKSVSAPFAKESPLQVAMKLVDIMPIPKNSTSIVIGEMLCAYVPSDAIHEDGFIDFEKFRGVSVLGLDSYHSTQQLARLSYAKPGLPTSPL